MKTIIFCISTLLASLTFAGLVIHVDVDRTEYLPGVQINGIRVQFTNEGNVPLKVYGPLCDWNTTYFIEIKTKQSILMPERPSELQQGRKVTEIKPHESISCIAFPYILTEPGEYCIRHIYDPTQAIAKVKHLPEDLYKTRIEGPWITIKIIEQNANDRSVYDAYFSKEHLSDWIDLHRDTILDKYPSSTYAGYALCRGRSQFNDAVLYLQCRDKATKWRDDEVNRTVPREPTIDQIKRYLEYKTDFIFNDVLRYTLSWKLALLGKYEESKAECTTIISANKSPIEVERCKEFIEYMTQKGFLKK